MIKKVLPVIILALIYGCNSIKTITLPEQIIEVDGLEKRITAVPNYQSSYTKKFDLIHTKLDVKFDWEKSQLYGKAAITLKPHFYATDSLVLNARGFDIHKIEQNTASGNKTLDYEYDNEKITIHLGKTYARRDTLTITVDYTSTPDSLEEGGSAAISSDKGLYFINPKGEEKNKKQQIWTQGETESNSAWFPTIDAPNQKSTQEIAITVDEKYETLSNGILSHSEINGDGTRTDFWEMNLPHAPYLFMMAIGEFEIIKDQWRDIDVDYYVESEYAPYAKDIFGLTPEMLEFFSNKLGVVYPWQKYSQVVVRDYVSGAMENTTAVIYGDFVYQTKRELIDGSIGEDIIAHELFHHWFGDLVTCESWSNLPLNESFATYGEFLWNEYKYGDDKAAHKLQKELNSYLREAKRTQKDMIRFDYNHREEMFDGHSYAKGGRILHMLRNYMGDEAFFTSLKLYLETNKYTDVEMHQLRIACEEVTGEDLNWFFNQWFYASGHPVLDIYYDYIDSTKTQLVTVQQIQDLTQTPIYRIPIHIDIYVNGQKETKKVVLDKIVNTFSFEVTQKPDLVNFDADKMLLCQKNDNHNNIKEWVYLFYNGSQYMDRYEAIKKLQDSDKKMSVDVMIDALKDPYEKIRIIAIQGLSNAVQADSQRVKNELIDLAKNDKNSLVKGEAIEALSQYFNIEEVRDVFINGVSEPSYYAVTKSLNALSEKSSEDALRLAKSLEEEKSAIVINSIANIYAEHGTADQLPYFIKIAEQITGDEKYDLISSYSKYLNRQDGETIIKGLPVLKDVAINEDTWWVRMVSIRSLTDMETKYDRKIDIAETELSKLEVGSEEETSLKGTINKDKMLQKAIKDIVIEIKEKEEAPILRKMLGLEEEE